MKPALHADHAIAAALLLLAAAVWLPPLTLQRPTFNHMVTFDVTQSMEVEDVALGGTPLSRLALARAAMRETLHRLPCGSHVGWSIFTGYRALPLMVPVEVCSHYEDLLASLELIDGRMRWTNASRVGKGLAWTVRSAEQIGGGVSVVFISDGHEAPPEHITGPASMAGITPGAVRGWIVGVGGALPARIPKTDRDGQAAGFWEAGDVVQLGGRTSHEHLSALREPHLQALARDMGFGYRRLVDADALASVLLDPRLARPAPVPTDLRWVPAALALVLLAWRFRPALPAAWRGRRGPGGADDGAAFK